MLPPRLTVDRSAALVSGNPRNRWRLLARASPKVLASSSYPSSTVFLLDTQPFVMSMVHGFTGEPTLSASPNNGTVLCSDLPPPFFFATSPVMLFRRRYHDATKAGKGHGLEDPSSTLRNLPPHPCIHGNIPISTAQQLHCAADVDRPTAEIDVEGRPTCGCVCGRFAHGRGIEVRGVCAEEIGSVHVEVCSVHVCRFVSRFCSHPFALAPVTIR